MKNAIVTGGTSGIGRAVAENGHLVIVALEQADSLTVAQVNGRKNLHKSKLPS